MSRAGTGGTLTADDGLQVRRNIRHRRFTGRRKTLRPPHVAEQVPCIHPKEVRDVEELLHRQGRRPCSFLLTVVWSMPSLAASTAWVIRRSHMATWMMRPSASSALGRAPG